MQISLHMTSCRRPLLPLAALIAATLAGSPLSAQAPAAAAPYKPSSFISAGLTSLSANGNSTNWYSLGYGLGYKKVFFNVNFNLHTETEILNSANDYQLGYLFLHRQPEPKRGAVGMGLTGGLWQPDEGKISPMAAFNMFGALGQRSRFVGNVMLGMIFPEGGDATMAFRVGLGWLH